MRRLIALALLLLLAVPAAAQQNLNQYPSGTFDIAPTAVSVTNTAAATTLYTKTVPASISENFHGTKPGATQLHLSLLGTISTNPSAGSTGAANLGCNFGGTTATIALVNGYTFPVGLSSAPLVLDVWVRQQGAGEVVVGRLQVASVSTTTGNTTANFLSSVIGTTAVTAPQTLACTWQWGSASATNTLTINNGTLAISH